MAKISILKLEVIIKNPWALRLWVDRRYEPILGLLCKTDDKKKKELG